MESENNTVPYLVLDKSGFLYLEETRKWSHFLSILGFIGIGILVLVGLFFGAFLGNFMGDAGAPIPGALFSLIYLVLALLYFFPVYYLYRFASNMKPALHEPNQENLNASFKYLRSLFRFMGIMSIIVLSLYLIIFVTAVIVAGLRGF